MSTAKIYPKASQAVGTNSNMPLLLIPTDITDIGTLTTAEAESIRIYTDSGLTTEVAREVLSADEIYFKAPSASSAMEFWVDWDGVRADYAVTDTYGRNAVWTGYSYVFHFKEGSGTNAENATGGTDGTLTSSALWGASAPFGAAVGLAADGTNYVTTALTGTISNYTITDWRYIFDAAGTGNARMFYGVQTGTPLNYIAGYYDDGNPVGSRDTTREFRGGVANTSIYQTTATLSAWQHRAQVSTKNTTGGMIAYRNGSAMGSANTTNNDVSLGTVTVDILAHNNNSTHTNIQQTGNYLSEWRFTTTPLSADWISTEYNNQIDNSAFWDSDPVGGGGATPAPMLTMMGVGA